MKKSILGLLLLYITFSVSAQTEVKPSENSPYSRLGLGDLVNQNFSANLGMGGLSAAFQDAYHLNIQNPAAASALKSTAYEIGINTKFSTLKDKVNTDKVTSGNIGYIALGFPLKNQVNELLDKRKKSDYSFGMHVALVPFTNVGYNIQTIKVVDNIGKTTYAYTGRGNTYRLYWGNSVGYKGFSAGVNLGYFFGSTSTQSAVAFNELASSYTTNVENAIKYRGFVWNTGVQYTYDFKKKGKSGKKESNGNRLVFGVHGNPTTNFNTVTNAIFSRTNTSYQYPNSGAYPVDSLFKIRSNDVDASGILPSELSIGAMYQKGTKYKMGINYSTSAWSKYKNEAKKELLSDTYKFAAGFEITPDATSYNNYGKKIRYRMGINYWTDPRMVAGEQLKGKSLSVGFGLPLVMPRQQVSFVNLTVEGGALSSAALSHNFIKVSAGFTLNDNSWFYKRRFN